MERIRKREMHMNFYLKNLKWRILNFDFLKCNEQVKIKLNVLRYESSFVNTVMEFENGDLVDLLNNCQLLKLIALMIYFNINSTIFNFKYLMIF